MTMDEDAKGENTESHHEWYRWNPGATFIFRGDEKSEKKRSEIQKES